jgi:membrane-associated phospholipid phosphatase
MADEIDGLRRSFERVSRDIVTAPARWRMRQWGLLLAITATTLLAYVDKWPIEAFFQAGGGAVPRAVAQLIDAYGGGLAVTLLGLAVFAAGKWTGRRVLVDAAVALAAAGIWCWIFTKTGQLVLAERRPNEGGAMRFFALGGHGASGHASGAAVLFSPVRDVLARGAAPPGRHIVTVALLAWAAVVSWSRVWLGMHFVWNVMLGLAIGFFTGLVATRALQQQSA